MKSCFANTSKHFSIFSIFLSLLKARVYAQSAYFILPVKAKQKEAICRQGAKNNLPTTRNFVSYPMHFFLFHLTYEVKPQQLLLRRCSSTFLEKKSGSGSFLIKCSVDLKKILFRVCPHAKFLQKSRTIFHWLNARQQAQITTIRMLSC